MPKTKKNSTHTTEPIGQTTQNIGPESQEGQKENNPLYWYPLPYVSYSSLSLFEECSYSFYLKYFLKIRFPETDSMKMGTIFQEALNAKYMGDDPLEVLKGMPKAEFNTAKTLMAQAHDFKNIISIDSKHMVDLGLGIPVMIVPDLLTEQEVVENKYSGGYYNPTMVKKQKQSTLYYQGTRKLFGAKDVYYQIFDRKKKNVELVKIDKTTADVDEMLFWMDNIIQGIKKSYDSGNWVTNTHTKFKCALGEACPAH